MGRPSLAPILLSFAAAVVVPSFIHSSSEYPIDQPVMKPPIKASPKRNKASLRSEIRSTQHIVQCSIAQYGAVQYSRVQYRAVHSSTVHHTTTHSTIWCRTTNNYINSNSVFEFLD